MNAETDQNTPPPAALSLHHPTPLRLGTRPGYIMAGYREDTTRFIIDAANQHVALLAERDALVARNVALRAVIEDMAENYDRCQRIYARMVNEHVSQITVSESERMLVHAAGRARAALKEGM